MNFTIKYHKPAQACMCLMGKPLANWSGGNYKFYNVAKQKVCSFKDVDYATNQTIRDELVHGLNTYSYSDYPSDTATKVWSANCNIYHGLTAYASNEAIADFDDDDYAVDSIGTATQGFSVGYTNCTYTVSVSNVSGQSDITVNSIKFTKPLIVGGIDANPTYVTCLMYSCYLDAPVVIPAGEEKVFVVVFNFLNP